MMMRSAPPFLDELGADAGAGAGRNDRLTPSTGGVQPFNDFFAGVRITSAGPGIGHGSLFYAGLRTITPKSIKRPRPGCKPQFPALPQAPLLPPRCIHTLRRAPPRGQIRLFANAKAPAAVSVILRATAIICE